MTDEDRTLLRIAARRYLHAGALAEDVHAELGVSATRFWQRLVRLLDDPDVAVEFPQLVARLRRLRDQRLRRRRVA